MPSYLLDANVVSELSKLRPDQSVLEFMSSTEDLWLPAIVVEELELGVQLLPNGRRREALRAWLNQLLADFSNRILPIAREEAEWAAIFRARVHKGGGVLSLADALVAGTAKTKDLFVATRNLRDFARLDIGVFNPWESG